MDNLTHTLTGLALSRAGLDRFHPRAALVLMISANMPDIDVLSVVGGQLSYLEHHRGITHSLVFSPVMAAVAAALSLAIARSRKGWGAAILLSWFGVLSHLVFDWTNAYAIRLALPFSGEWFHSDLNHVVDLWILAALLLSLLGPMLAGLVSSEIGGKPGKGRGLAIFALSFILLYDFGRFLLHQRAIETMSARTYDGSAPRGVAAFPTLANPFVWVGWVDTPAASIRFDVNLLTDFDPSSGTKYFKPDPNPAIQAARTTEPFRVLGDFAIYPLMELSPADEPEGATRVELRDQRFPFTATAVVDKANRVVRSAFHF